MFAAMKKKKNPGQHTKSEKKRREKQHFSEHEKGLIENFLSIMCSYLCNDRNKCIASFDRNQSNYHGIRGKLPPHVRPTSQQRSVYPRINALCVCVCFMARRFAAAVAALVGCWPNRPNKKCGYKTPAFHGAPCLC